MTPLQKLPKNVGYLGKFIVAKGFEKLHQVQKSPNLVTVDTNDDEKCKHGELSLLCIWNFEGRENNQNMKY